MLRQELHGRGRGLPQGGAVTGDLDALAVEDLESSLEVVPLLLGGQVGRGRWL